MLVAMVFSGDVIRVGWRRYEKEEENLIYYTRDFSN